MGRARRRRRSDDEALRQMAALDAIMQALHAADARNECAAVLAACTQAHAIIKALRKCRDRFVAQMCRYQTDDARAALIAMRERILDEAHEKQHAWAMDALAEALEVIKHHHRRGEPDEVATAVRLLKEFADTLHALWN